MQLHFCHCNTLGCKVLGLWVWEHSQLRVQLSRALGTRKGGVCHQGGEMRSAMGWTLSVLGLQTIKPHKHFFSMDVVNVPSPVSKVPCSPCTWELSCRHHRSWGLAGERVGDIWVCMRSWSQQRCPHLCPTTVSSCSLGCRSPPASISHGVAAGKQQPLNSPKASHGARAELSCCVCCNNRATCWVADCHQR